MSIMLMVSILMIGCTNQPPPIPAPMPTPMVMVDERAMVMESLTRLNNASNNYIRFLQGTTDIYNLGIYTYTPEETQYHISYVASKLTALSLNIYGDAINLWEPPEDSIYYDRLIEIKEAELYRIKYFGEVTDMMLLALPTENEEAIQVVHDMFIAWRDNPLNQKPMNLQNDILIELDIDSDSVDFMYVIPKTPLPTLPPVFTQGENRS